MKRTLLIILLILTLLISLATLLAAYGGMFNPRHFHSIPAIAAMTFPVWVIITPLTALVCFFIKRKMALIPLITMVLCIGPFLDFCPLNFRFHKPEIENGFTLLTYNTYFELNYLTEQRDSMTTTLDAILMADADVVCMQETVFSNKYYRKTLASPSLDSIEARYPYKVIANPSLCVLSKYPVEKVENPALPGATADLMIADVTIRGKQVRIYSVHLQSIGLSDDDKELYMELTKGKTDNNLRQAKSSLLSKLSLAFKNRALQASRLKELITGMPAENVIICGDFNDIPGCYAMRKLESAGLKNAYTHAGFGPSYTYRANRFYFHIDQVLYSSGLNPVYMDVINEGSSDHLPVLTYFEFK
ncbi:MAG: endonuclease/exonuclease/phosphatase family protein [Muribaculaceae bacterium]|nr:endonuclease/exonuclease/phosphatase family protein [Muribaculaceae bacterium]